MGAIGVIGFSLLVLGVIFLPSTVIVAPGMLPTLAAAVSVRRHRALKAFTIGALNFAGCLVFLIELWSGGQTVPHAVALLTNPRTIIVMWCAAGIGYVIEWGVSAMAGLFLKQRLQSRLKSVRAEQARLVERWGAEVSGDAMIDAAGSARPAPRAIGAEP